MYCKEKWRTAGGKDPLFGRVDGFQIGPSKLVWMWKTLCRQIAETQVMMGLPNGIRFAIISRMDFAHPSR